MVSLIKLQRKSPDLYFVAGRGGGKDKGPLHEVEHGRAILGGKSFSSVL